MDNILLLVVLGFLVLMGYVGRKKGFIRIMLSMVAMIVTLIIVVFASPTVSKVLKDNTPVYNVIYKQVNEYVVDQIQGEVNESDAAKQLESIEGLPIPSALKDVLKENVNQYESLGVATLGDYISSSLSIMLVNAIAFILTYVVVSLVVKFIIRFADIISKLPVINGINKTAGVIVGVLEGILIVWVGCILLTAVGSTAFGQSMFEMIYDSKILSFIYNNNILMQFVTSRFMI